MKPLKLVSLCAAALAALAGPAWAQLTAGPAIPLSLAGTQEIAYDPVHDAYLAVGQGSTGGTTSGSFIDATTRIAGAPFVLNVNGVGTLGIRAV
jgi:hypothetical protein